jgi:quinol monooxygenase YgiN
MRGAALGEVLKQMSVRAGHARSFGALPVVLYSQGGDAMVITILEAQVAPDKVAVLEAAYKQGIEQLDAGITKTYLVRSSKDSSAWRIITVWESRDALEQLRRSGETPRGVLMFRAADAEPMLSVFDVVAHAVA